MTQPSNPIIALFRSRKFLIALTDMVISLVLYYNAAPLEIIAILQPVIAILIASIAYEDGQEKSAPSMTNVQAESVGNVGTTNTAAPTEPTTPERKE